MRYILLIFGLLFAQIGFSQKYVTKKTAPEKALKFYKKGKQYARSGAYSKAIQQYEKALKVSPTFIDAMLYKAGANYELKNDDIAEKEFEAVLALGEEYRPKVLVTLGLMEMAKDKYGEAIEHFERFLTYPQKSEAFKAKIEGTLKDARFAEKAVKNPVPFNPENLGENINTPNSEYLPSLTVDGNTLIYTVKIRGQEDFYISQKENGKWQQGRNLGQPVNTSDNEGAQSISANGKLLVYTMCSDRKGYGSCDLYYSVRQGAKWTTPQNIGPPINSRGWESQPSLSSDGTMLYYAANRKGGKGGKDIWVSSLNAEGRWGRPQNLGENINTKGDEQSPFIHPDGQTLYFISSGHAGMGRSDIFLARRQADGKWGEPKNLGYPINSKGNELSLIVSLDGKTAYYASDKAGKKNLDLYRFELYEGARPQAVTYVEAKVFDEKTKKPLQTTIEFVNLATGQVHLASSTDQDGEFLVCLPKGKNFALNVSKKGYLFHSENFALKEVHSLDKPFKLDIGMQAIPPRIVSTNPSNPKPSSVPTKSKPIVLRNVFFESGSAVLKETSKIELNRLRDLLTENPTMKIQISGHTDNVGSDSNNLSLSTNRAKSVVRYLASQGIRQSRLSSMGYGETQPIAPNDTKENKQLNRRTEFKVLDF